MGQLTLIIGGARSGKSSFGERLAGETSGQVVYLATAQGLDDEMRQRILNHQRQRPEGWTTIELPRDVGRQWTGLQVDAEVVILDCLTLLVSNLVVAAMEDPHLNGEDQAVGEVLREVDELLEVIRDSPAGWLVVTNEVGLGLVPPNPMGRIYRDLLGFTNQRFASQAERVYWMVAGIPVPVHGFKV
jgi:adenosylcobinamide kinase/adenosylcobinamide-phosphate guanylyltransferase